MSMLMMKIPRNCFLVPPTTWPHTLKISLTDMIRTLCLKETTHETHVATLYISLTLTHLHSLHFSAIPIVIYAL
ncbi:hypothetical protein HanRHA438_Chr15g0707991 [Helianthus annuus]|nr:hypothetical protein HanRHA438_Chr15g0707991 [Helianthus annuus]